MHFVIRLVRFAVFNATYAPHITPAMININGLCGLQVFVAIHDETGNVSKTIYPARVPTEAFVANLECYLCSRFEISAVQDDFRHPLITVFVRHNGSKQSVS